MICRNNRKKLYNHKHKSAHQNYKLVIKTIFLIFLHVLIPVTIGITIYLFFRTNTLLVFKWANFFGLLEIIGVIRSYTLQLVNIIPDFILYSLPDGIWVYSATIMFLILWHKCTNNWYKISWILLPLLCSMIAEILQYFSIIEGTFCIVDICFNIAFFFLSLSLFHFFIRRQISCIFQY